MGGKECRIFEYGKESSKFYKLRHGKQNKPSAYTLCLSGLRWDWGLGQLV